MKILLAALLFCVAGYGQTVTTLPTDVGASKAVIDTNFSNLLTGKVHYAGTYNSGTTYGAMDFVTYNGVPYVSLQSVNSNRQPDTNSAWWGPYCSVCLISNGAFADLLANSRIGNSSSQVAAGNHTHPGVYEPVDVTILRQANLTGSGTAITPAHSDHTHTGVYEPVVTHGTSSQYFAGDFSLHTFLTDTRGALSVAAGLSYNSSTGQFSLGANVVRTDQANAYTTGAQDFSGATNLRIPNIANYTPTLSGQLGYDAVANTYKGYVGAAVKTFAFIDSVPTIPSVIHLIKGDGSGNGADTKVTLTAPATAWTIVPAGDNQTTTIPGGTLVPNSVTVNGHPLSANVTVSASDLNTGTLPSTQLPTALVAQKFFGTAAPGSVATNLPGDFFTNTTAHAEYVCNAPSGTSAPACTSVTAAGWMRVDGGGLGAAVLTPVSFSATPVFPVTSTTQGFTITLTSAVTSSTFSGSPADGQEVWFRICENGTGGFPFVYPASVLGATPIDTTLSTCNAQIFKYSTSLTSYVAVAPGTSDNATPGIVTTSGVLGLPTAPDTLVGLASTNNFTGRQNSAGAVSTAPFASGTTLPGTCAVNDGFFKTNATPGQNLYYCTATNTWTQQRGSDVPQNSQSVAYTTVMSDSGKHILHPTSDNNARTFTIDSNANVAYPVGTTITFVNQVNTVTIAITSDTLQLAGTVTTGTRTLAVGGFAVALKITSTLWFISGQGLT